MFQKIQEFFFPFLGIVSNIKNKEEKKFLVNYKN